MNEKIKQQNLINKSNYVADISVMWTITSIYNKLIIEVLENRRGAGFLKPRGKIVISNSFFILFSFTILSNFYFLNNRLLSCLTINMGIYEHNSSH